MKVFFLPGKEEVDAQPGERIIDIARRARIPIKVDCGGVGKCGMCAVRMPPQLPPGRVSTQSEEERRIFRSETEQQDLRLACVARVYGDVTVEIPAESVSASVSPRKPFTKYKIPIEPSVRRVVLELPPSTAAERQMTLSERIRRALDQVGASQIAGPNLAGLARFSREWSGAKATMATATIYRDREITELRPGVHTDTFGVALDLGTTSVVAFLCDLANDRILGVRSALNPQVSFGEDVIARIAQVQMVPDKLGTLHSVLIEEVNRLIQNLVQEAGIDTRDILDVVAVGNPTMQHFLLNFDPVPLGQAPYLPVCREGGEVRACELGLHLNPGVRVHVLPMASGFLGGDTLSVLLTLRPDVLKNGTTLVVDVGTNGEVVLIDRGHLVGTSCATGPAFEGAQIRSGMRAGPGAIEKLWIEAATGTIRYRVIGYEDAGQPVKPLGVCGSGVISAVCVMLEAGILRPDGAFDLERAHPLVKRAGGEGLPEFVIVPAEESGTGRAIVIGQMDVRAVQLGKAALRAGIEMLLKERRVEKVDRILLAGTFGSYIDPLEAVRLGMLPEMDSGTIEAIGNAAGDGARLALFNQRILEQASALADKIQVVELTRRHDFQDVFVESMGF